MVNVYSAPQAIQTVIIAKKVMLMMDMYVSMDH
jgi:hypothetical protein